MSAPIDRGLGYCPICGGVIRERRPNGNDRCGNGHNYPSAEGWADPQLHITNGEAWRRARRCDGCGD
jgi:hypothetical protein